MVIGLVLENKFMPNGSAEWYEKDLPVLEAFFSKIADVLERFAQSHNLLIDKYYHQGPDWDLLFRHPENGVGQIIVRMFGEEKVKIYPAWWIDNYDVNRRDSKHEEGISCSIKHEELHAMLENLFRKIVSWRKEDLIKGAPHPSFLDWRKEMTKEEFEKQDDRYPIPKL
jgi:hypothetical protein